MAPEWIETQKRWDVALGTTPITFFGMEWQAVSRRIRSSGKRLADAVTR
jgi:hypothetical protein